jgi:hypothetical protein
MKARQEKIAAIKEEIANLTMEIPYVGPRNPRAYKRLCKKRDVLRRRLEKLEKR